MDQIIPYRSGLSLPNIGQFAWRTQVEVVGHAADTVNRH